MVDNERQFLTAERIARLEQRSDMFDMEILDLKEAVRDIADKLNTLVGSVDKIRIAMYFIALSVSANVPIVQKILAETFKLAGF